MAEPILREPVSTQPLQPLEVVRVPKSTTQDLFERVQSRWEELKQRIANPTAANRPSVIRELRDEADHVRLRIRHYHESRPLQAVGLAAAATFALGLFIGLRRR